MRFLFELIIAVLLVVSVAGHCETAVRHNTIQKEYRECMRDAKFNYSRAQFLERVVTEGWAKANGLEDK